jgi:archaellum component FlaC
MTPEERFERIEAQLELLANFMSQSAERIDQRFDRIGEHIEQLGRRVDQTSRDVAVVAESVATLARLFDRHTSDGHGGGGQQP